MVYVVRDIVKECKTNIEDEDEDDWDGLLDDIQDFVGEIGEEEDERSVEVKQEITTQVENIQHLFESLFR